MKPQTRQKLKEKGWADHEISHAEEVIERKRAEDVYFSKIVFWSALVVIVFGNLVVSLILIPFLVVLNSTTLYAIIVLLAGTMGYLYKFLITDIGHLDKKHHQLASVIIPVIALINLVVMVTASNRFIIDIKAENPLHNVWLSSILFAVVFIIPYVVNQVHMAILEKKD